MSGAQPIHLCIGAPRAGSTWLFREMSEHPALFVPRVKEVRYWNSRRSDQERDHAVRDAVKVIADCHDIPDQERWLAKWASIRQSAAPKIENYIDLMSVEGRPSLEISPSYCFLQPKLIRTLRDGLPAGSKVLYLIRDPMARTSSQIKLHYSLHGAYRGRPSQADLAEFMDIPTQRKRWDYAGVMDSWETVFGTDFIPLPFDDVVRDPKGLTLRVADALGIDLASGIADRPAANFFHSEKNQNAQIWVSSLGPDEKTQIAKAMLPDIQRFCEKMPEQGMPWLNRLTAHAESESTRPEFITDIDLPTQKLMRMTESLGDNCEYGFWQRHRGYEPSSLFRWAITPIDSLLAFLDEPAPLFAMKDLTPYSGGMVHDTQFGFKFHSKLRVPPEGTDPFEYAKSFAAIYEDEAAKIAHLQTKFFAQMRRQTGLYVLKDNKGLTEDQARRVLAHLHAKNPNHHLMWVEADLPEGQEPTLKDLGGGLLRGALSRFAPYTVADDYAQGGWNALMTLASRHDVIAEQIKRMQR